MNKRVGVNRSDWKVRESRNLQGAGNDIDEEEEECAGRDREKVGSVEFHDLVKINVGTGFAKGLTSRLSMQCKPRH